MFNDNVASAPECQITVLVATIVVVVIHMVHYMFALEHINGDSKCAYVSNYKPYTKKNNIREQSKRQ